MLQNLSIDPEFQSKIPPLTAEERSQEHPEIEYTILEKEFAGREEAVLWICKNQLGRRNLTPEQHCCLMGKQDEPEKKAGYDRVGDTDQINEEQAETVRMIFDLYQQGKGSLQIANELNARRPKSAMGLVK